MHIFDAGQGIQIPLPALMAGRGGRVIRPQPGIRPAAMRHMLIIFAVATVVMLGAFRFAGWYADNSLLPRFCEAPEPTLARVREILIKDRPSGDEARRPYIIAAKLIFLVPRDSAESMDDYIERLRAELWRRCTPGG
jgi:hypothetical protein